MRADELKGDKRVFEQLRRLMTEQRNRSPVP